jgi:hypothetical protein
MVKKIPVQEASLILAAEECERASFHSIHKFSRHDETIIGKLMAHGPVLLQGGRGTGKSALMIAASLGLAPADAESDVLGFYISLRYVPLLRSEGPKYEKTFCEWVSAQIQQVLQGEATEFPTASEPGRLKIALSRLAASSGKRIVLFFDDAAHLGRETSLSTFFDIFRNLGSDVISCKAAIYPGVTEFGTRFDVYNDATVVDVVRDPEDPAFEALFHEIMSARYPELASHKTTGFTIKELAGFLGGAVLGNTRAFVFACNDLHDNLSDGSSLGFNALGSSLLRLAADYYWPLFEEVTPKLGKYVTAVSVSEEIVQRLYQAAANPSNATSVLVHRKLVARYAKPFELLEYAGFLVRREASRAMKSGGRGPRYDLNLCNLLEKTPGTRLTSALFKDWHDKSTNPLEVHERGNLLDGVLVALPDERQELEILSKPIDILKKSPAYPYGLTDLKIERLKEADITTVRGLADASDEQLLSIESVGEVFVDRFRSVTAQAIWM